MDEQERRDLQEAAETFRTTIEEWILNNLFRALVSADELSLRKFERVDDGQPTAVIQIDDAPGLRVTILTEWIDDTARADDADDGQGEG